MMKKFAILAVSIFIFTSCSTDDEITERDLPGEWQLVRTTTPSGDSERGAEMDWQESYFLRADGTFTKERVWDGETSAAEGAFILHDEPYGNAGTAHISMVYESQNDLIASCYTSQLKEKLYFESDELMVSSWEHCDGLGLEYAKKD